MAVAVFFALAVVAVEVWDTGVPVWALLLSIILPIVYILPSGFIYAMTGQGVRFLLSFLWGDTLLIVIYSTDYPEYSSANHSWNVVTW